jgi:hypothetical protein
VPSQDLGADCRVKVRLISSYTPELLSHPRPPTD